MLAGIGVDRVLGDIFLTVTPDTNIRSCHAAHRCLLFIYLRLCQSVIDLSTIHGTVGLLAYVHKT